MKYQEIYRALNEGMRKEAGVLDKLIKGVTKGIPKHIISTPGKNLDANAFKWLLTTGALKGNNKALNALPKSIIINPLTGNKLTSPVKGLSLLERLDSYNMGSWLQHLRQHGAHFGVDFPVAGQRVKYNKGTFITEDIPSYFKDSWLTRFINGIKKYKTNKELSRRFIPTESALKYVGPEHPMYNTLLKDQKVRDILPVPKYKY